MKVSRGEVEIETLKRELAELADLGYAVVCQGGEVHFTPCSPPCGACLYDCPTKVWTINGGPYFSPDDHVWGDEAGEGGR